MKLIEDILDWNRYEVQVDGIPQLSRLEKSQAKNAFNYLSKTLGHNFLRKAKAKSSDRVPHPIFSLLLNLAPWTRREIVRWAESMRTLEGSPNLDRFLSKLAEPKEFVHSTVLLESSAKLVREGLRVSFEPTFPIGNGQKQPDARFENPSTSESFFLEVAILRQAHTEQEAFRAMNAITFRLMRTLPGVHWAGRLHKTPSGLHLEEILGKVDQALKRSERNEDFVQISEEGTFEIALCNEAKLPLLSDWCSAKGLEVGGFEGPSYDINHVERLKQKIRTEQKQLPTDAPSAILVEYVDVFMHTQDKRRLISDLEEEVYEHKHVPFVIVSGTVLGGGPPEVIQKGEHRYAFRYTDLIGEHSLVLVNRFSPTKLSTNLFAKVLRAF